MPNFVIEDLELAWNALQSMIPAAAIHNEEQYLRSVEALEALMDIVGNNKSHPLYELMDTLGVLVRVYEDGNVDGSQSITGIEVLEYLMEEHTLTDQDLPEIGDAETVREILDGNAELSVKQIRSLARRFGISPAAFL